MLALILSFNFTLIAAMLGAVVMGIILGIMGGGGSILTIPILVYIMGFPETEATAYSLLVVGITAGVSGYRYLRMKLVYNPGVLFFGVPSILAVFAAQFWIMPLIPDPLLQTGDSVLSKGMGIMLLFALLMLLASRSMIRGRKDDESTESTPELRIPALISLGTAVGLLSGIVGAGGGFLIIPALVVFARLHIRTAIGTSLAIIAINSTLGFTGALLRGLQPQWDFLLPFIALAVTGAFVGMALSNRIPARKLRPAFGWFVLVMGVFIIVKTLLK